MSAAGAVPIQATTSFPGLTRTREGDGSPASHAAAAAAAADEAAAAEAAEAEAELQTTTTRANLLCSGTDCAMSALVPLLYISSFFF